MIDPDEPKPGTPPEIKVRRERTAIIVTSIFPYSGEVLEKVIFQRELEAILKLLESERSNAHV